MMFNILITHILFFIAVFLVWCITGLNERGRMKSKTISVIDEEIKRLGNKCNRLQDNLDRQCDMYAKLFYKYDKLRQKTNWLNECKVMILYKDGDSWAFVLPSFENLQISPSVWKKDEGMFFDSIYSELKEEEEENKCQT